MNFIPSDNDTILRTVVGSTLHGLAVDDGSEDRDELGICIEPPEYVIGIQTFEQYVYRSAEEREARKNVKSYAGDLDLVVYSLRKYVRLALKGNPTILLPLYAPQEHIIHCDSYGQQLRAMRDHFLSKKTGQAFLGYLRNQRQRLEGTRGQKRVNRPELVAKYGYDTKFLSHALRLGYQGVEIMQTRNLELPMRQPIRNFLVEVRTGQIPYDDCLTILSLLEEELKALIDVSDLPDSPDTKLVQDWLVNTYFRKWQNKFLAYKYLYGGLNR